jgi:hypothetical protein
MVGIAKHATRRASTHPGPSSASIGRSLRRCVVRVYQQVIDMGEGGADKLETVLGCTLAEDFALFSGPGVLSTNCPPIQKNAPQLETRNGLEDARAAR